MGQFIVIIIIVLLLFRACSSDDSASSSDEGQQKSIVDESTRESAMASKPTASPTSRPPTQTTAVTPVPTKAEKPVEVKPKPFSFKDLSDAVIKAEDAAFIANALSKYSAALPDLRNALYRKCAAALRSGQSHDVVLSTTVNDELKMIFGTTEERQRLIKNLDERIATLIGQEDHIKSSMQDRSGQILTQFEALLNASQDTRSSIEKGKSQIVVLEGQLASELAKMDEFKAFVAHSMPILGVTATSQKLAELFEQGPK